MLYIYVIEQAVLKVLGVLGLKLETYVKFFNYVFQLSCGN